MNEFQLIHANEGNRRSPCGHEITADSLSAKYLIDDIAVFKTSQKWYFLSAILIYRNGKRSVEMAKLTILKAIPD